MNYYQRKAERHAHVFSLLTIGLAIYIAGLLLFTAVVWIKAQPILYVQDKPLRYMGLPRPPQCGHLYNVGRHREWAECMGVGYKEEL